MAKLLSTIIFITLCGCSKTCYIQEIEPSSINSISYSQKERSNATGYERYQRLLNKLHQNGPCKRVGPESKVNVFKLRFCNFMLGYRNDDKNALIAMAKEISDYYKKMRLYDLARTFDSYRDVLLFGHETITESWDDTMDLLEAFQTELEKAKKERECCLKKQRSKDQSFFSKLFGKGKSTCNESCNCQWNDSNITVQDKIAIPNILSEPPGCCSPRNPLLFKRQPNYDACLGLQPRTIQTCQQCPVNIRQTGDRSINAARRYMR